METRSDSTHESNSSLVDIEETVAPLKTSDDHENYKDATKEDDSSRKHKRTRLLIPDTLETLTE